MIDTGLLRLFAREIFLPRVQERGPSPSNRMSPLRIKEALENGGAADGRFASGYLFHTANITQVITGAKNCLDIGAAPGCQMLEVAVMNPEIQFIGVDTNETLLQLGKKNAHRRRKKYPANNRGTLRVRENLNRYYAMCWLSRLTL